MILFWELRQDASTTSPQAVRNVCPYHLPTYYVLRYLVVISQQLSCSTFHKYEGGYLGSTHSFRLIRLEVFAAEGYEYKNSTVQAVNCN